MQESNVSAPADSDVKTDVVEQKPEASEVKDNETSSTGQNTKIVNLQDIKAKKQQPAIDLNHMEPVPICSQKEKAYIQKRKNQSVYRYRR